MNKPSHQNRLVSSSKKLIKRSKKDSYDPIPEEKIKSGKLLVEVFKKDKKEQILTLSFNKPTSLLEVKTAIYDNMNNNDLNTSDLVGFEVFPQNYVFDYKFELGLGNLEENLQLICFTRSKEKELDKYKICCCLAIGGFSKVFLVRCKADGKFFAAKFMEKSKKELMNTVLLENEKEISLNLSSPFLVKTHEFIDNEQFYIFIMDYCPGGELFYLLKQIKCMSEEQARVCFVQILLGIEVLHNFGYMYRDLKPENILLDASGYLKIADFGLAKPFANKSYSFCGSIEYMAPEIIRGKGHNNQVDFYCLGALLYEMLIGHPPFYDSNSTQEESKARILYDEIEFAPGLEISDAAKDLIMKLTNKNEKERLGCFGGSKEIMSHPWVGKINREKYEKKLYFPPFPVNLDQLNFDPDEIGQSERNFEERIRESISITKPKEWKSLEVKKKSRRHNSLCKMIKFEKEKSKTFLTCLHLSKDKISPYIKGLAKNNRNSISLKIFKTESNEQRKKLCNKKYLENLRITEANGFKEKENKLFCEASKLRKKGKYYGFSTITDNNEIILKLKSCKKEMKCRNWLGESKGFEKLGWNNENY